MNEEPLLSIIVPVYNAEKWIKKCIDSILSQTFSDFELILVDDGSKDSSGRICDDYKSTDKRIKVLHVANGGVSNARNIGIGNASGKWLSFIDSDDWISQNYLKSFNIVDAEYDICYQGIQYVFPNGTTEDLFSYSDVTICKNNVNINDIERNRLLFDGCPVAKIFRTSIVNKYAIRFNTRLCMHEDHIFVFDYLLHANNISCISNIGYNYRRDVGGSLSSKMHSPESLFIASDLLMERIKLIYDDGLLREGDLCDELLTHYGFSQRLRAIINTYYLRYGRDKRKNIILQDKSNSKIMNFYKQKFKCSSFFRFLFIKSFCYLPFNLFDYLTWILTFLKKV